MLYIQITSPETFKELTETAFNALPGSSSATRVKVKHYVLSSTNPDVERKVDSVTPQVSVRRFLAKVFPDISYSLAGKLASLIVDDRQELVIL